MQALDLRARSSSEKNITGYFYCLVISSAEF
jgi:hypothetical protein